MRMEGQEGETRPGQLFDLDGFISSSRRIFNVSRKPDMKEFQEMAKVTGLGVIVIGIIGYIVKLFLDGVLRLV